MNASRFCLAIRSIGSEDIFELRAPKRGGRLGWKDASGQKTSVRYIAHDGRPGVLCWRDATEAEVAALKENEPKKGRSKKVTEALVLLALQGSGGTENYSKLVQSIQDLADCSRAAAAKALSTAVDNGLIVKTAGIYTLPSEVS